MPYHTNDVPDARLIDTFWLQRTRAAVSRAVREPDDMKMIAVLGDAGLGKSLAVEVAVADHPALEVHWFDFWRRATTPQVARTLAARLANIHDRIWLDQLDPLLIDALAQKPRILVIEEAQRLGYDTIEYLRRLHDQENTQFAVVFVGGNGCWKTISKYQMVASRISQRIEFAPLRPDEVVAKLPRFHPLIRKTTPDLIRKIDRLWAHGAFRAWALFVEHAIDICAPLNLKNVDENVAKNAMTQLGVEWEEASGVTSDPSEGDELSDDTGAELDEGVSDA